jgi:hypothetical protein
LAITDFGMDVGIAFSIAKNHENVNLSSALRIDPFPWKRPISRLECLR